MQRNRSLCLWGFVAFAAMLMGACPATTREPREIRHIAIGSCADQNRPLPIWDKIIARNPDVFVFLGDSVYADTSDMKVMRAAYQKLGADPGYQRLRQQCPVLAVWDDHDYGRNDAGVEYAQKDASKQIFLRFFDVPKTSPRWKHEGNYDAVTRGPPSQRIQFILLDTRYFRSPLSRYERGAQPKNTGPYAPSADETATVLGDAQWQWLEARLAEPAQLRIIASSIQVVSNEHGWEGWGTFPSERERLFSLIDRTKAGGVIFISGDRHHSELSRFDGSAYPLYDLTSSGLNQKGLKYDEANRYRVGERYRKPNFGMIEVDWKETQTVITLEIRNLAGDAVIQEQLPLSSLHPWAQ